MRKLTRGTWVGILCLCILLFILECRLFSIVNALAFGTLGEFDPFLVVLGIVMALTFVAGVAALFALTQKDEV